MLLPASTLRVSNSRRRHGSVSPLINPRSHFACSRQLNHRPAARRNFATRHYRPRASIAYVTGRIAEVRIYAGILSEKAKRDTRLTYRYGPTPNHHLLTATAAAATRPLFPIDRESVARPVPTRVTINGIAESIQVKYRLYLQDSGRETIQLSVCPYDLRRATPRNVYCPTVRARTERGASAGSLATARRRAMRRYNDFTPRWPRLDVFGTGKTREVEHGKYLSARDQRIYADANPALRCVNDSHATGQIPMVTGGIATFSTSPPTANRLPLPADSYAMDVPSASTRPVYDRSTTTQADAEQASCHVQLLSRTQLAPRWQRKRPPKCNRSHPARNPAASLGE